jgi:hypothetical protein
MGGRSDPTHPVHAFLEHFVKSLIRVDPRSEWAAGGDEQRVTVGHAALAGVPQ